MNINEREKLFEWKYENNPYTQKPFIYLALSGEHIVAHFACVIEKFVHNKDEFLVGFVGDAIVHPDFQRKGLFSKLLNYACEDMLGNSNIRLLLCLSANEGSTISLLRSGFIHLGERDSMYFISPVNKLKKIIRYNNFDNTFISHKKDVTIEITQDLKVREISGLMQSFTGKNKIYNVRDEEFYKWEFADSPNKYIYAYCKEGDETTGYLSLRKNNNSLMEYTLMEYGYLKPSCFNYLIEETSKKLLIPSLIASTLTRNQEELLNLKRSGFICSDDIGIKVMKTLARISKNKLPALVKPISPDFNDTAYFIDGVDMRLSNNWSFFDSDVW